MIRAGGILATFDPNSGTLLHEARLKDAIGNYYASPVAGDGKIYLVSEQGKITVVKPGAKWEVLTSSDLAEDVIATLRSRMETSTSGPPRICLALDMRAA